MGKKVIFLDIDGTLTEPGLNVPPESALKAIKMTQEKGNYVFLCTGRNRNMLAPLLKYNFDGAIGSSGGYITYGDEVIYDCPMTEEQRERVLNTLLDNGVFRTVECRDNSYTDESFKRFLEENSSKEGNSELLRWRKQIEESLAIKPMAEYGGEPVYKVVVMSPSMKELEIPIKVLGDEFNFCIQEPDKYGFINGEVVNRKFDKGSAVEIVCEYLGVSIEDSYGFGDSMNDREMLEVAGHSICMENGAKAMKEISDYVCPSVTEDGLFKAFEHMGLI